jgi:hypothetical protein
MGVVPIDGLAIDQSPRSYLSSYIIVPSHTRSGSPHSTSLLCPSRRQDRQDDINMELGDVALDSSGLGQGPVEGFGFHKNLGIS